MLHTLVSAEVKTSTRGSQYAILLYKLDPDNKLEHPKSIVVFDKNQINYILNGNITPTLDIVEVDYSLNGTYQMSNGVVTNHVNVCAIQTAQYENTDSGVKYIGKTFAHGYSPQEIGERMKHEMTKL